MTRPSTRRHGRGGDRADLRRRAPCPALFRLHTSPPLAAILFGSLPSSNVAPPGGRAAIRATGAALAGRHREVGMTGHLCRLACGSALKRHGGQSRAVAHPLRFRPRPGQSRARSLDGACGERCTATARDGVAERHPHMPRSVSRSGLRGGRRQECTPHDGGGGLIENVF